ncbi:hypothetical protein K8Q52_00430 [Escherichia coli]|uniref:hypothetical protein n=1 Tax=Escherichia coli TaxID=562 RepID=UPI0040680C16
MKNKISFIISDITNKGGTERVTALLSNILSSNIENAEVEIFSLQKNANPFYFLSNKISVKYGNGWRYYSLLSYLIF